MKRFTMIAVAMMGLAMSAGAYANCNGRGCDTPTPGGGQGGAGGNGTGVGVGVGVGVGIGQGGNGYGGQGGEGGRGGAGGSVLGSGNSSNVNSNKQGQMQGQQQGQAQSSRNSNRNDNRSSARANNSNSNANSGNNSDQSVTVQGDNYEARRIPVATAYAPSISPTATCMGSSMAGVQAPGLGVSFGTSWTDENCMKLERVRTVAVVLDDPATAAAMMCDIPDYAKAREAAGKPCGSVNVASAGQPNAGTNYTAATALSQGQPEQARVATVAQPAVVVSPVPPRVERYRVTLAGLQPL